MAVDPVDDAQAPVTPIRIATDSNYGDSRSCTDSKGNPIRECVPTDFHPGVDLVGVPGTPVVAPHDGWILFASPISDAPPWRGYGPAIVLLAHDDVRDSISSKLVNAVTMKPGGSAQAAIYSLLAHLDPKTLPIKRTADARLEEVLGRDPAPESKNWRLAPSGHSAPQEIMTFQPGDGRTQAWSNVDDDNARYVTKGQILGYIGDARHVHWETRLAPFGTRRSDQTIDPWGWLSVYKGTHMPEIEHHASLPDAPGGGVVGLLLALWSAYELLK